MGSFNFRGCPFIPKPLIPCAPHNRAAYNEFILWISKLRLLDVRHVVDAGANWGDFSQAAQTFFPSAQIIAFEPLPDLAQPLAALAKRHNPRWIIEPVALGASTGETTLHLAEGDDTIGSLVGFSKEYLAANPHVRQTRSIPCRVARLDDVLEQKKITRVDLLKIDVEGFEFDVLAGAAKTLQAVRSLIVEISLVRSQQKDPLRELLAILNQNSLYVVDIIPSWFDPGHPWKPVEFNILARRE